MIKKNFLIVLSIFLTLSLAAESSHINDKKINTKDTIRDESIVLPAILQEDLDNLVKDWYIQTRTVIDSTCVSEKTNPYTSDSTFVSRLSKLPTEMEMSFNDVVKSYIDVYTERKRSFVSYMLGLGTYYFPIFEQALDKYDLPMELKYLPIIESALKPNAVSRAGAAGLWQFMVGTGKIYGLEINSLLDERRDPVKSTDAAARYLKELYNIYQDWNLVIAAYNCGPGNVNKAIKRANGDKDYWKIYYNLPKETRGYVPAFIAANYVMNYSSAHNICPVINDLPLATDTIWVNEMLHFKQIADVLQIPIEQLRSLNPQYKKDIVPGHTKKSILKLPFQHACAFIDNKDSIFSYNTSSLLVNNRRYIEPGDGAQSDHSDNSLFHKVKSGESLSRIAHKYGVKVANLMDWNNLKSTRLNKGQRLVVYTSSKYNNSKTIELAETNKNKEHNGNSSEFVYHKVEKGENLWEISQKYQGITAKQLIKENHLKTNNLMPGQIIKVPKS